MTRFSKRTQKAIDWTQTCPCGLGDPYGDCCGRFHTGAQTPPTAESLMRSRYSAFAVGDTTYLLDSWHPTTKPHQLRLDPSLRWTRLAILSSAGGGLFDADGSVEFRAHYLEDGQPGALHEHSRFIRHEGRWSYLDGDLTGQMADSEPFTN